MLDLTALIVVEEESEETRTTGLVIFNKIFGGIETDSMSFSSTPSSKLVLDVANKSGAVESKVEAFDKNETGKPIDDELGDKLELFKLSITHALVTVGLQVKSDNVSEDSELSPAICKLFPGLVSRLLVKDR